MKGGMAMNEIQSTDRKRFEVRVKEFGKGERVWGSAESHKGYKKLLVNALNFYTLEKIESVRVINFALKEEIRIAREGRTGRIKFLKVRKNN